MSGPSKRQIHGISMTDRLLKWHLQEEAERQKKAEKAQLEKEEAAQRVAARIQALEQYMHAEQAPEAITSSCKAPTEEQLERARRNREEAMRKRASAAASLSCNAPTEEQLERARRNREEAMRKRASAAASLSCNAPTEEQLERARRNREEAMRKRAVAAELKGEDIGVKAVKMPRHDTASRYKLVTAHAQVMISGLRVRLPVGFQPYSTQMRIMVQQVSCLRKAEMLSMDNVSQCRRPITMMCDAPTGKSVALLAPACAWLAAYKQQQRERRSECPVHAPGGHAASACTCLPNVTIIYCTRTKAQMKQAIGQYGSLPYCTENILRHSMLGSREDLCTSTTAESRVKSGAAKSLTSACLKMMSDKGGGCSLRHVLYSRYDRVPSELRKRMLQCNGGEKAFDLEDLVTALGDEDPKVCPYYAATDVLAGTADIIFCTFNYVVDPLIRERVGCIRLDNSILLVDEAHGLIATCNDAISYEFELNNIHGIMGSIEDSQRYAEGRLKELEAKYKGTSAQKVRNSVESLQRRMVDMRHISSMLTAFDAWCRASMSEAALNHLDKTQYETSMVLSVAMPKSFMELFYDTSGTDAVASAMALRAGQAIIRFYDKCPDDELLSFENNMSRPTDESMDTLMQFLNLQRLIAKDEQKFRCSFKVEKTDGSTPLEQCFTTFDPSSVYTVQFWPIDASVGFKDATKSCRFVSLASATLSPTKVYMSQFGVECDVALEGLKSIIPETNVFAAVISRGPNGAPLKGTRSNTQHADCVYFKDVASIIVHVCTITPRGVLCFLPSVAMLTKLLVNMRSSGAYADLSSFKAIYVEGTTAGPNLVHYRHAIQQGRDALLLAVCRGSASEGLNFEDDMARAIVILSVPYPNIGDSRVKLRSSNMCNHDWLTVQAMCAVAQALGRSLRHSLDWSSVLLVDTRYNDQHYKKLLPTLINAKLKDYETLPALLPHLQQFYKCMQERDRDVAIKST